jgi:hypothetical protein
MIQFLLDCILSREVEQLLFVGFIGTNLLLVAFIILCAIVWLGKGVWMLWKLVRS